MVGQDQACRRGKGRIDRALEARSLHARQGLRSVIEPHKQRRHLRGRARRTSRGTAETSIPTAGAIATCVRPSTASRWTRWWTHKSTPRRPLFAFPDISGLLYHLARSRNESNSPKRNVARATGWLVVDGETTKTLEGQSHRLSGHFAQDDLEPGPQVGICRRFAVRNQYSFRQDSKGVKRSAQQEEWQIS